MASSPCKVIESTTSSILPSPVTARHSISCQRFTHRNKPFFRRHHLSHALLTLSGTAAGSAAIAFMIMAKNSLDADPWRNTGFIALFAIWAFAILTFVLCNCGLMSTRTGTGAQLHPAAHYILRTLTGVLCSTVLLLERLQSYGQADQLWMFLPLAVSLSACLCSVFGDVGESFDGDGGGGNEQGREMHSEHGEHGSMATRMAGGGF